MYKIALSGKAKVGKNTVADLIKEKLANPEKTIIAAFADPMKEIVMTMFPNYDHEALYGPSELRQNVIPDAYDANGLPLTYRQLLLDLGKFSRAYHPNIWANCFIETMKGALHPYAEIENPEVYIASDARFHNELNILKQNGFITIRVKRDAGFVINDVSETEQDMITDDKFDFIIQNDKSIDELKIIVDDILLKIKEKH